MVVVLSRFRVANGMRDDVVRAFQQRPRAVEQAPGFLWLDVFSDADDPAVFHLMTRWTDRASFDRWHRSPAHRDSHALIPRGLKLDPAWTNVCTLERLEHTTGSSPLTDVVADAPLLFSTVVEQSAAMHFLVLAHNGMIRSCNAAARQQLASGGDLIGSHITDYMPQADGARLQGLLAQPGRQGAPVRLNFAPINGVPFTLECWLSVQGEQTVLVGGPALGSEQQLQHQLIAMNQELAVLARDRSRQARDQQVGREAAERTNRERNAFLSMLAHELRQPLGGALAALGVLRKLNPDPELTPARALMQRQLEQITRLVEDLADTARVAGGEVDLRRSPLDLVEQLRELATAWAATGEQQHKTFRCHLPDQPLMVWADSQRLQQVFSNLVGNAFKYTPPGGTVVVTVRAGGSSALVSIEDDGEGIAPEGLPRIFDLFQRATTTGSGLGIGLAVVHALVTAHGGTVTVASPGVGQGATFTVRLPLAAASP